MSANNLASINFLSVMLFFTTLCFSCKNEKKKPMEIVDSITTSVIKISNLKPIKDHWGTLYLHHEAKETSSLQNLTTGIAKILPKKEIHPPHVHEEEEFLYIISGKGEWTVKDSVFSAKAGDLLYAEPWQLHGIENTGDSPLSFYFLKWNSKNLPIPKSKTFKNAVGNLITQVISKEKGEKIEDTWGELYLHKNEYNTYGMKQMVTGVAFIKSGKEIHPPHTHTEEEFLIVTSGSGEWTVKDQTFKAEAGDLLYAAPNDLHGIKNTGNTDLSFYFLKWK